jgi:primosomal protein N' (replication factor Y)
LSAQGETDTEAGGVLKVAVPSPLRQVFDYLPAGPAPLPAPGVRVQVPFGRRQVVGLVLAHARASALPAAKMRRIQRVLDDEPILDASLLRLLRFTSDYFQHPVGEVMSAMLPAALRKGLPAQASRMRRYRVTATGTQVLASGSLRGARQRQVLEQLAAAPQGQARAELRVPLAVLQRLQALRCIEEVEAGAEAFDGTVEAGPPRNAEQQLAVQTVLEQRGRFVPFLLEGVTGSGKTEVYLGIIQEVLRAGGQALVLVPEIGLTPQIVRRFERRLGVAVAAVHSSLAESERLGSWLRARSGDAAVVVGTRSAVFTPLPRLGVVVVDEEHDASFKQQDGVRYSARDLAVLRARDAGVPIVLGSATPCLESLHNVDAGRYRVLRLSRRAGSARPPAIRVLDLRGRVVEGGLCAPMLQAVESCLHGGEQAILFVNRRGYAPVMLCRECGTPVDCERCDAHLVLHLDDERLHCHHCGHERAVPTRCACGASDCMRSVGLGTQRVIELLQRRLPQARIARVDRDSTRHRGAMAQLMQRFEARELDVLVGTQMLAKGHDFAGVTLVGILDGDAGLFSTDFRATERMAQLIVQVAGRAGRSEAPGSVLIQSHHPDNPLLRTLVTRDYRSFSRGLLQEREAAGLPPFGHVALLRAEAVEAAAANAFLTAARECAPPSPAVQLLGPVPSPMQRRAGHHRAQLLVESAQRGALQGVLRDWLPRIGELRDARRVRWSVDVDPQDMG